jgi:hypothetical protein
VSVSVQLAQRPLRSIADLEVDVPCDAIAVAKGQVERDLARELEGLGIEAVSQALLVLLRQRFAHLGEPELVHLWGAHSGARASGIGIRLGHILVRISPQWRITVNTRKASQPGGEETVQQVRDAVAGLLTALAGLAVQLRLAQAISQAGYGVTHQTRAPNGALVVSVEL